MTVKDLIDSLQKWIKDGLTKETDKIYVVTDSLNYDISECFNATFFGTSSPEYDKNDPSKQCIFIGCLDRIPNCSNKNQDDKYKQYGTGYDTIELNCDIDENSIELLIAKNQYEHLEKKIKHLEKLIEQKKKSEKFIQTELEL